MKFLRLEAALGHTFGRPDYLRQAMTHRSYAKPHYERLEFLGDSVLNCAISSALYRRFPGLKEGELSRLRANLVRQETLAEIAARVSLGEFILLGEGELKSGGERRPSILADALEAAIGAIFLDAGFDVAQAAVERLYRDAVAAIDPMVSGKDAKTHLQEILQAQRFPVPSYRILSTRGEAHAQEFEVECLIPALKIRSLGVGSSRRIAEQQAAQRAIDAISESKA
ncbi:MAG TPA: ribonuclease III [Rhodocyclaceae bacterium]|nr:ribonuclease III [Rhodocyclaceae bacterium]